MCNSGLYRECRAYNSFNLRRYFLVAQYNGWTNSMNITANLNFPQSREASSANYNTYLGWTSSGWGAYYNTWSGSLSTSYLTAATPPYGLAPAIYSTTVLATESLMTVAVDLTGFTLFSNQRTQGSFFGSYISLTLGSFTELEGCGAVVFNTPSPVYSNNALYCIVNSSSLITIYSNADVNLTGYLYVTFFTNNVPASSNYTFRLYDKYYSGSNNGLAV